MQSAISVFLITLGLGQLIATTWRLNGASLVGASRWVGYSAGLLLVFFGAVILPQSYTVLYWTPLAGLLAFFVLLWGGSFIKPIPHPNILFTPEHLAHGSCLSVRIPDGDDFVPGLFLLPTPEKVTDSAVLIVPGAGDTKVSFKWRLIESLLAQGLTVLTIDLPGHGDYKNRRLVFPDCLSTIPVALKYLQAQPGISNIGLVGISLGGAISIRSIAEQEQVLADLVKAIVIIGTPIKVAYSRSLFYGEMWRTYFRSPTISLLKEITVKQVRESWLSGGYRSKHTTGELFDLLNPIEHISCLGDIPILLIYSRRDKVATPAQSLAMRQAAPHADYIEMKRASHIMLTLIPEINERIAQWLVEKLNGKIY